MKRLKSYFFTNTNLNSRGKYISLKDNAEPNETLFSDMLDSVVKPKVGSDYQDQADYNAVNTKDSTKFTTAENLPEVDTTGSLLTITTTAAVDTNLLRRKKYTVAVNTPVNTSDISSRVDSKLVTPANLPKFALDNSLYSQQDGQVSYYDSPITETTDAGLFTIYKLKLKALTSEMITHSGVRLNTVLNTLRVDVNACVSDAELASAVSTLNTAIGLKANKVTPTFVTGYNGTKVVVNSQGVVTSVSKASALDITNDSSVSGSTVKDALNWLKANGGGTGGASDTDGVTNLSTVPGATATDALNNLSASIAAIVPFISSDVEINSSNTSGWTTPTFNVSPLVNYRVAAQSANIELVLPSYTSADLNKVILVYKGFDDTRVTTFTGYPVILSKRGDCVGFICTSVGWLPFTTSIDISDDLTLKADINSPTFTGTPSGPTATSGTNTTQLATTAFVTSAIKEINSYKSVTTGSPTFDKQAYNGIGNSGTYTLPTSTGKYEVLAIIIEGSLSVTVTGLGGGYGDLVFTNQNETAYLIDTIYGWYPLAVSIDLITQTVTNGVTDKSPSEDAVYDFVTGLGLDKICPNLVTLIASTYVANPNDSIRARPQINSSNINITINPGVEGQCIYIKNQSVASGNTYTVNLIGYYSHSLSAEEWVLIRYFGAEWEVIATNQNSGGTSDDIVNSSTVSGATVTDALDSLQNDIDTIPTPTLDSVTGAGNTTTNSIEVGGLVVDYPSGLGVAVEITKGGAGEALTVNKTSGSGNVASFNNGTTLIMSVNDNGVAITQLDLQSTTKGLGLNRVPVSDPAGSTGRNGLLWYDDTNHLFKGTQNGGTVKFSTSIMPANTVKVNNTASSTDAVDLTITTETVLGRTASVNSGNIAPIPLQTSISAETSLVAGTRTITDSRVTSTTVVIISPSNTGTLTQQIRYTKNIGTSIVFTAGGSDTCTFSYFIIF